MTPAQRLMLSARQAAEQVQRLAGWIEAHKAARPEVMALNDEVESISAAIGRIIDAVEQRPSVGVAGGYGSGKMALVGGLCGNAERPLRAEFPNREASLDVLSSIVPHRGGARMAAAIRLTASEPPNAPRGFPVRLRLLGQLDVVKLMHRAHAAHVGYPPSGLVTAAGVAALFADAERQLQPRAVAGLSARDVADLREDVMTYAPRSEHLRVLAAAGYWDRLALVVAHLPEAERTKLLSLLWNEEPVLTALYALLNGTIEKLGHAGEVFCELNAIVAREPVTGWMVPHRWSIVAADTLAGLAQALGPVPLATVQVSGRFGGSIAVDRAVLAALAAELPLTLAAAPLGGLPDTDLVTFPGAPLLANVMRPVPATAAIDGTKTIGGGLAPEAAAAILGHAKSAYLIERAARRHAITSLVVCVDPAQPADDTFASAIGDWIEITQGAEPHHRERMRSGLFVVITRPEQAGDGAMRVEPWREALRETAVRRWLEDGIGVDQHWAEEWTPDHGFENFYAFHRPQRAASRPADTQLRLVGGEMASDLRQPNAAASLVQALDVVATRAKKHRQLGLALNEQRRRLRSRVLRHHHSNDPLEIAEWRRQVANVAVNKLRRAMPGNRRNGLSAGTFAAALSPSETELLAAIARAGREHDQGHDLDAPGTLPSVAGAIENSSIRHDCAAAAVTYWQRAMRQVGRSRRFCRHLGVPQTVLQHVVDEIGVGAARNDLVATMTTAFARIAPSPAGAAAGDVHLAANAARIIGSYLASIFRTTMTARPERGPGHAVPRAIEAVAAGVNPAQAVAFGGTGWTGALASLVEANIAAVPGLVDAAERDRELGELLAGFASSPFEVEL